MGGGVEAEMAGDCGGGLGDAGVGRRRDDP